MSYYSSGRDGALSEFGLSKVAVDMKAFAQAAGNVAVPLTGTYDSMGAGLASGIMAPPGQGFNRGFTTAVSASAGRTIGRMAGQGLGALAGKPELGAGLGSMAGGAIGAAAGHATKKAPSQPSTDKVDHTGKDEPGKPSKGEKKETEKKDDKKSPPKKSEKVAAELEKLARATMPVPKQMASQRLGDAWKAHGSVGSGVSAPTTTHTPLASSPKDLNRANELAYWTGQSGSAQSAPAAPKKLTGLDKIRALSGN